MLKVKLSKGSYRTLSKLQRSNLKTAKLIVEKIDQLAEDPQSIPSVVLSGHSPFKRFRVGDYRVVFCIKDHCLLVFIIDHRSKIYQQLEKSLHKAIFNEE